MSKPDLEELLNALVPFAQHMLAKSGEFYPFGVSMLTDGQVQQNAADTGTEHPESQELIDLLTEGFQTEAAAGKLRAAGICFDSRVVLPGTTDKTDAICLKLEHADGEALKLYLPYTKGWLGKIKYGELVAGKGEPLFFQPLDGAN